MRAAGDDEIFLVEAEKCREPEKPVMQPEFAVDYISLDSSERSL